MKRLFRGLAILGFLISLTYAETKQKEWTARECLIAGIALNNAINKIIIAKVQQGIRPTKTEACHLPNVTNAYLERCKRYDVSERYTQIEEISPSYKYACELWVE